MSDARAERPSVKARQRQLREDAILDAARALLAAKGFGAMTLDDVVAEAGVARATLYGHFASKDDLGAAVLAREMRGALVRLRESADRMPPDQALRTTIDRVFEEHFSRDGYHDFASLLPLFGREVLRTADRELVETTAALVERAQAEGTVRRGVSPVVVAQTLHSVVKDPEHEAAFARGELNLADLKAEVTKLLLG